MEYQFYFATALNLMLVGIIIWQSTAIRKAYDVITKNNADIILMTEYVVTEVHNKAVIKEDFETAAKCRNALNELKDLQK